jgi:hypothetical protein
MKTLFVLVISVLLNANLFSQGNSPFMTRTFPASSINSVEASTCVGSITVDGGATSEAVVEMFVSPEYNQKSFLGIVVSRSNIQNDWSDEEIKRALEEDYVVDIKVKDRKLYAVAKPKNRRIQLVLRVSFKISVPEQVNSNLKTGINSIKIANLSGTHNLNSGGGLLAIENVSGKIIGSTLGGAITVTNSKDFIDLKSTGIGGMGSVSAKNCYGEIRLQTFDGMIRINDINGDVNVRTRNGNVTSNNVKGTIKTETGVWQ